MALVVAARRTLSRESSFCALWFISLSVWVGFVQAIVSFFWKVNIEFRMKDLLAELFVFGVLVELGGPYR